MGSAVDRSTPIRFTKLLTSAAEAGRTIAYPSGTQNHHHEVELAAALGEGAANIPLAPVDARLAPS